MLQQEVREAFVIELNPEGPNFPSNLGELTERLKRWRNKLQTQLEDQMPAVLRLEEECRALKVRGGGEWRGWCPLYVCDVVSMWGWEAPGCRQVTATY